MKFLLLILVAVSTFAQDGWRSLFNGKDLSGWVPVQVAPNTFTVRDGIIVSTGVPTGVMRTDRQYENFELELEWKHIVPQGNAGVFVWSYPITALGQPFTRAIEVQVLDGQNEETYTSHGDVFAIHGAHMKPHRPHPKGWERSLPSEWRCKPAGEWNHYRIVCNNGDLTLAVNGKVVSGGSQCTPRKGYICLEAEGSECHFRNIRIKELPTTNPKPEEIAPLADTFVSIYNGLNLGGWTPKGTGKWSAKNWILQYDGTSADAELSYDKDLTNFEIIVDWRVPDKDARQDFGYAVEHHGKDGLETDSATITSQKKPGEWTRSTITVTSDKITCKLDGKGGESGGTRPVPYPPGTKRKFRLQAPGHAIEFANIYLKELPEK